MLSMREKQPVVSVDPSNVVLGSASTLQDVEREAIETLWLKSILHLTPDQLGLDDAKHANQFKAIMALLFHELRTSSRSWEKSQEKLTTEISTKIVRSIVWKLVKLFLFDNPYKQLNREFRLSNEEKLAKFDVLFAKTTDDFLHDIIVLNELQNDLLLESDCIDLKTLVLDPLCACIRKLALLLCDVKDHQPQLSVVSQGLNTEEKDDRLATVSAQLHLGRRQSSNDEFNAIQKDIEAILQNMTTRLLAKAVTAQSAKFDMANMRKIHGLDASERIQQIKKIAKDNHFSRSWLNDLLKIQKKYIACHARFIALFEDTCAGIQQRFPGFSEEIFRGCYDKAFAIFDHDKHANSLPLNIIYEYYLMEARYPQFQMDLQKTVHFFASLYHFSLVDIANSLKQQEHTPLSLQEIILWARSAMHSGASPWPDDTRPANIQSIMDSARVVSQDRHLTLFRPKHNGQDVRHHLDDCKMEMLTTFPQYIQDYENRFKSMPHGIDAAFVFGFFAQESITMSSLEQLIALDCVIQDNLKDRKAYKKLTPKILQKAWDILEHHLNSDEFPPAHKIEYIHAWQDHPYFKGFFMQRKLESTKDDLASILNQRNPLKIPLS